MNALRFFAIFSFVAGIGLLIVGFVRSGDSGAEAGPEPTEFSSTPTPTPTEGLPTATVNTETAQVPPTPTVTPFAGALSRMVIESLEVDAAIEAIGLLDTNQLDVPAEPLNVGWYDLYSLPGWGGNAVFAAHVDYYPDIRGPFYSLKNIAEGAEIAVIMEDGTRYTYQVIRYKRYDANTIPMGDLIWPPDRPATEEWITLITCGGEFQELTPDGPGEYLQRDVVVARRIIQ